MFALRVAQLHITGTIRMSTNSLPCSNASWTKFTTFRSRRYARTHSIIIFPYLSPFFLNCMHQTFELSHRIYEAEKQVKRLVEDESSPSPVGHSDLESHQDRPGEYDPDEGSDDDEVGDAESIDALDDLFHDLEAEVATLVADVHDLALYTKLNITGFLKILKVRCRTFLSFALVLTELDPFHRSACRNTM